MRQKSARQAGSIFVAASAAVASRARARVRAILNETLLGHSIRVTGPLLLPPPPPPSSISIYPEFSWTKLQTNSSAERQSLTARRRRRSRLHADGRAQNRLSLVLPLPTHDVFKVTVAAAACERGSIQPLVGGR